MLYTFGCHINFTRLLLLRYVPLLGAISGTSRGDIRHFFYYMSPKLGSDGRCQSLDITQKIGLFGKWKMEKWKIGWRELMCQPIFPT